VKTAQIRNVRVGVQVLRVYKVNALVRLYMRGGTVRSEKAGLERYVPPDTEVEFLVPRTSLEGLDA
jgi:hypothetical protein